MYRLRTGLGSTATPSELKLIRAALYSAAQWEDSLAEAWGHDTPEHKRASDTAARYRNLRTKLFPGSEHDGESPDCKTVTLQEIAAGANRRFGGR